MELKSHEIIALFGKVVTVRPRNSPVTLFWFTILEIICAEFISPRHLRLYLQLYWGLWHPNVNFVHRPTFDVAQSNAGLIAAMAIIGAYVYPNHSDNETAKTWFTCVAEMVFRDADFCYDDEDEDNAPVFPFNHRIQSIQAAYIVCQFQNWEGTDSSKRRIRSFRYSTLVAVSLDVVSPIGIFLNREKLA